MSPILFINYAKNIIIGYTLITTVYVEQLQYKSLSQLPTTVTHFLKYHTILTILFIIYAFINIYVCLTMTKKKLNSSLLCIYI